MGADLSLVEAGLALRKADKVIKGGRLVNVLSGEIYPADVAVYGSRIVATGDLQEHTGPKTEVIDARGDFLVPGLIDGHIHFEVTKLSPTMFAKLVLPYGTTSIVTGLDQIFGVAGLDGVREFLNESETAHLRMFFGAPAKLPYTIPSSTLRHTFGPREHKTTSEWKEKVGVWETVGEFVIGSPAAKLPPDKRVWSALELASKKKLPVLGCAPLLRGSKLAGYICAGIRSDHECYSAEESLEKLRNGLFIMIRESSVVHFFDENIRVVTEKKVDSRRIAFCTDDVTATDVLLRGHLDNLVRKAIKSGIEPVKAIQMATLNCAEIYRIDNLVGSISPGRFADILILSDLDQFTIREVFSGGRLVAADGNMVEKLSPPPRKGSLIKSFNLKPVRSADLTVKTSVKTQNVKVLSMQISREIPFVRKRRDAVLPVQDGRVLPSPDKDLLYVCVVERHLGTGNKAVAFISGFNLKSGAMASSLSPDDNNMICVGTDPKEMAVAINKVLGMQGGQVVVESGKILASISLPIGGIVADIEPGEMSVMETNLDKTARDLGSDLESPFMSMIFLPITAIPDYAITDKGLVDCTTFKIINPVINPVIGPA